ncbi:MAG TPA: 23S rRNA (adenine(2503)-C(2))-methyltransferase RlmN [bacterium]|nr:23S rRNA (adenine(2503)-C(2))-methyltransferase RlmN [bacterium]
MNLINLEKIFLDQPKFRLGQAKKLIFKDFIEDWSQASVFSLGLRDDLKDKFSLKIDSQLFIAKDNKSGKAIITLSDGSKIETALMIHSGNRNTACLSCQVGCPLACKFCASGKNFRRNLTVDEILLQAIFWGRYLKSKKIGNLTNIVFMGSGEPFLNYGNVFKSIEHLNNPDYFDISSRKISVSTIGIVDGIRKMSNEKNKVNLAISLHFTDDKTRASIMPGTKKYPLKRLFDAIDYYIEKTNRKVMFEYMMIKGLNDSIKDAENLAILMKKPLYVVNLIKYNETGAFESSDSKDIINFKNILKRKGIEVVERFRLNQDVLGACGQLISK